MYIIILGPYGWPLSTMILERVIGIMEEVGQFLNFLSKKRVDCVIYLSAA